MSDSGASRVPPRPAADPVAEYEEAEVAAAPSHVTPRRTRAAGGKQAAASPAESEELAGSDSNADSDADASNKVLPASIYISTAPGAVSAGNNFRMIF